MRPCCNAVLSSGTAFAVTPENTASTMAWCTKSFMRSSGPGAVQEVVEGNGSGGNPGTDGRPIGRVPILAAYSSADTDRAVIFPIRIENETFNTLKNQGYRFEHNFGHGECHLSTVFAYLMMLAFLIDQCQQRCCALFQAAQAKAARARYFWERVRVLFLGSELTGWDGLGDALPSPRLRVPVRDHHP